MTDTEHGGMTALTPKQMRALATRLDSVVRNEGLWGYEAEDVERAAAALRTAADQLEAAEEWAELELQGEQPNEYQRGYQMAAAHARRFILVAGTATQEDDHV